MKKAYFLHFQNNLQAANNDSRSTSIAVADTGIKNLYRLKSREGDLSLASRNILNVNFLNEKNLCFLQKKESPQKML